MDIKIFSLYFHKPIEKSLNFYILNYINHDSQDKNENLNFRTDLNILTHLSLLDKSMLYSLIKF